MNNIPHKNPTYKLKVVCTFSNFYKGWIDYSENGVAKESETHGGTQTVVLTNEGQTGYIAAKSLDQFHADAVGHILIHHTDKEESSNTLASCFYRPDDSTNK